MNMWSTAGERAPSSIRRLARVGLEPLTDEQRWLATRATGAVARWSRFATGRHPRSALCLVSTGALKRRTKTNQDSSKA